MSIEPLIGGTNARTTFSFYNATTKQFEYSQDLITVCMMSHSHLEIPTMMAIKTLSTPEEAGMKIPMEQEQWLLEQNLLPNGVGSIPKVGDFNSDGIDDVVYLGVSSLGDGKLGIYLNNGDATFTSASFNGPGSIAPFQLADIDNNGYLDILSSGTINSSLYQPLWYKTCFNTASTLDETACDSYKAPSGAVYTESGTYEDIIENSIGCDSVITINLTVYLPIMKQPQLPFAMEKLTILELSL